MGKKEKKPEELKQPEETKKPEEKPAEKIEENKKLEDKKEESKPEGKKTEESKEASPPPPPLEEIVLRVYIHCEGCARKVKRCLRVTIMPKDIQLARRIRGERA